MRTRLSLWLLGLCAVSSGCDMAVITVRNLAYESALQTDNVLTCLRNRRLANAAWGQAQGADPGHEYSKDYARGFKDGFADYLDADGCGGPPPLPPRCYWLLPYRTPPGHAASHDWFAGFQHGLAAAQASGYRRWATVPSSAPGPATLHPPLPPPPPPNGLPSPPGGEPELPLPRQLGPAPGDPEPAALPQPGALPRERLKVEPEAEDDATAQPARQGVAAAD